jgi:hypothetical protein
MDCEGFLVLSVSDVRDMSAAGCVTNYLFLKYVCAL